MRGRQRCRAQRDQLRTFPGLALITSLILTLLTAAGLMCAALSLLTPRLREKLPHRVLVVVAAELGGILLAQKVSPYLRPTCWAVLESVIALVAAVRQPPRPKARRRRA